MIVDVIEEINQQDLLVCNLYTNPTTEKSYKNKELIDTVKHVMEIAITQRTTIIVGGDWNNQTSKIRRLTTKYGLKNSEVESTRHRGKKENDILATNLGTPVHSKAYNEDWMSDHYLVEGIIKWQTNCETKKIKRITKSNVLKQKYKHNKNNATVVLSRWN